MKNLALGILALLFVVGCSAVGGVDKGEVQEMVRDYYAFYPYMLGLPENSDSIRFGGHGFFEDGVKTGKYRAKITDIKIVDVGKPRSDKSVAVKCLIKGQYTRHDKSVLVEKEFVFVVGKDDFNKTTLEDGEGLRGITRK